MKFARHYFGSALFRGNQSLSDTLAFTADILQIIWASLRDRSDDLHHLVEFSTNYSSWLEAEAFLACQKQKALRKFCEVTHLPTYGSEGITSTGGQPSTDYGALRVGGNPIKS